jgi:putative hemolysin
MSTHRIEPTAPEHPRPRPLLHPEGIAELEDGPYRVTFARDEADLEAVTRLRFEVFNRELGEGLTESWATGRDEDRFDHACHHLMLTEASTGALVGTYRMQTAEMACAGEGFYCAQEFDLDTLAPGAVESSVELGRACVAREHRSGMALYALWRGLASYVVWSGKRLLFGCCSLTSQDPAEGESMYRKLVREGRLSRDHTVLPRPELACHVTPDQEADLPAVDTPRLFATYLRYGAQACGPPAIDREFGTIDFFIVLDVGRIDPRVRRMFFAGLMPRPTAT